MLNRQKITVALAVTICLMLGTTAMAEKKPSTNPFTQHIKVFDLDIYATDTTPTDKVLHATGVFFQWLDNDEDGVPDNQAVYNALVAAKATLVMKATEDEFGGNWAWVCETYIPDEETRSYCELYGEETITDAIVDGVVVGPHDASWEEIWHVISDAGYAVVYPSVFGCYTGTEIADAMDIARGGHFENPVIPGGGYPPEAWYYYDDRTCDYGCMITEYFYWLIGTLLGAHDFHGDLFGSCEEIQREWIPCNAAELEVIDVEGYALVTDPTYMLPTILPDGHYNP